MKERGMLFSKPMVLALLDGSKTQTRRICKPQPVLNGHFWELYGAGWSENIRRVPAVPGHSLATRNPYGQPGDRIWARESWRAARGWDNSKPSDICHNSPVLFPADGAAINADACDEDEINEYGKLRPSMFMPRWASRIDLEITGVRVERLQDISEADAKAEGIESAFDGTRWRMYDHCDGEEKSLYVGPRWTIDPIRSYKSLWLSINGAGSWDANPWIWVIEFRRVKP